MGAYSFIDFYQTDSWESAWKKWHVDHQPQSEAEWDEYPGYVDGYGRKDDCRFLGVISSDDVDINDEHAVREWCHSVMRDMQKDDEICLKWGPAIVMRLGEEGDSWVVFGFMAE